MMRSIINAIYNGNPTIFNAGFGNNIDYGDTHKQISELIDDLKTKVDKKDHNKFLDLEDLQNEIMVLEVDNSFKHGFCIGTLLMIEVFTAKNLLSQPDKEQS